VRTHGTGCIYSAAIAAGLAQGVSLVEAVRQAKRCIVGAISGHFRWGAVDALNPMPTDASS
jgi:hydroxymethylpyrimidine/phosphomethylpyrimidine kinase